jgi:hypothetical protein
LRKPISAMAARARFTCGSGDRECEPGPITKVPSLTRSPRRRAAGWTRARRDRTPWPF